LFGFEEIFMNELDSIVENARAAHLPRPRTPAELENAKAQFTGKSGRITELMKGMAALSVEEKKTRGAAINVAKQAIEAALNARRQALADAELESQLKAESLDVTLPGRVASPVACTRCQPDAGAHRADLCEHGI
jgi:phenylalanyl-tRNA synthetase alpha chain